MASWQTRAICLYLRATRKRRYATAERGLRVMANGTAAAAPPERLRDRLSVQTLGNFEVTRVRSPTASDDRGTLVYFHGGAFISGISARHWDLVRHLSDATQRDVYVPHYGLAPRHGAHDALVLLEQLHRRLSAAAPLHLVGDSAGGNLALLLAQSYTDDDHIAGLTLIAPWLDLSMTNPGIDAVEPHDPWLARPGLRPIAAQWAGKHDLQDPAVSPIFGDVDRLPPTAVFVGRRDICLPDCERLRDKASPPVSLTLHVEAGSPHVYPLLPTPEGRHARRAIVSHIRRTFVDPVASDPPPPEH